MDCNYISLYLNEEEKKYIYVVTPVNTSLCLPRASKKRWETREEGGSRMEFSGARKGLPPASCFHKFEINFQREEGGGRKGLLL